ncbi:hypothetical protein [Desulfocicer niacini]
MLNNPEFTRKQLERESNPLGLCTFSLGKLKLVASVMQVESCPADHEPFEYYDRHSISALADVTTTAIDMIRLLAEFTGKQIDGLTREREALRKELEVYRNQA